MSTLTQTHSFTTSLLFDHTTRSSRHAAVSKRPARAEAEIPALWRQSITHDTGIRRLNAWICLILAILTLAAGAYCGTVLAQTFQGDNLSHAVARIAAPGSR